MLNDRFEIQGEVGRGPTGTVFRAEEKATGQMVAIKQVTNAPETEIIVQRFAAELDKIQKIDHPNAVKVYECVQDEQGWCIVSEFVEGLSLQQRVIQSGKLPVSEALQIVSAVTSAVMAGHANSLLHLNLKPSNILLAGEGDAMVVKVTDFSLWRAGSDPGGLQPALAFYQAPEQRRNSGMATTSDTYALGKLLYVIVSGEMSGRISPESVPANSALQELIYRCIRTSPQDRFVGMDQVLQALAKIDSGPVDSGVPVSTIVAENQGSRLPKLAPSPNAAPMDMGALPNEELMQGSGQSRALAELDGMLGAAQRHLEGRRLEETRDLLNEIQQKAQQYADLHGPEWLQENAALLDDLTQELDRREAELKELVSSARAALEEARYEDCQLYCAAAEELSADAVGVGAYQEKARQMLANINVFWEDAHQAFKLGDVDKCDVSCMKLLDLRPNHPEALQMREQIHKRARRKKLMKVAMGLILLLALIAVPAGLYGTWLLRRSQQTKRFDELLATKQGDEAARIAKSITKFHGPARDFLAARRKADASLEKMTEQREQIDAEQAPTRDETADKWKEAETARAAAEAALRVADHRESEGQAVLAENLYQEIRVRIMLKDIVIPAMEQENWNLAYETTKEVLKIRPDTEAAAMIMGRLKQYLIPELKIRTFLNKQELSGARIYIDGKLRKERSPNSLVLETGKRYKIRVLMPPRGGRYYLPYEKSIKLEESIAETLHVELEAMPGPVEGKVWKVPSLGMKMASIPKGSFEMGNNDDAKDQRPEHKIALTRSFWIGAYEVTQAEYAKLTGENPSKGKRGQNFPVDTVSWTEANEFCKKLTAAESALNRLPVGFEYRLPTEAEWEYACRAGLFGPDDLDAVAWHSENGGASNFQEVGKKKANPWGLYDMHGNVAEWCRDWYSAKSYGRHAKKDPTGPGRAEEKVVRGGSRASSATKCLATSRLKFAPKARYKHLGFRIVLAPAPSRRR